MGREENENRIRLLEARIENATGDTIQLRRERNSLLNISIRVPNEILAYIFIWAVAQCRHLPRLPHQPIIKSPANNYSAVKGM